MTDSPTGDKWTAKIVVDETIINLLSSSIYRSIHIALKELVSNAWDADAVNVEVFIREDTNKILIVDDGRGMTREVLEKYPNIAMSEKHKMPLTDLRRPTIGKYGVGIWSALPFCKRITVQSTIKGTSEVNYLVIDNKWTNERGEQLVKSGQEISSSCEGETYHDEDLIDQQGTTIVLDGIFDSTWSEIQSPPDGRLTGIMKYSGIERIKWYLQQYTPIEYGETAEPYVSFFGGKTFEVMNLFLNGKKLQRNTVEDVWVLESCDYDVIPDTDIKCKYLIVTSKKPIEPREMSGLQIRLKNVAVGLPKDFSIHTMGRHLHGRMSYISGEIEIIEGMDDQINLEREDFLISPKREALFKFFRKKLAANASKTEALSESQKLIRAYGNKNKIKDIEGDFLYGDAVKDSTVKKVADSKSKSDLKEEVKNTLKRVGYDVVERTATVEDSSIKIDHEEKIVYITNSENKKHPLFCLFGKEIFESDTGTNVRRLVEIINENTLSFNYSHPILKGTSDIELIKKILGSVFLLLYEENVPEEKIEKINEAINSLVPGPKED